MPFGFDGRTKAYRRYQLGAASALSGILGSMGSYAYSRYFGRSKARPMSRFRRYGRRRYGRRGGRKAAGRARGANRKLIAGKGIFQRRFRKVIGRRLDTRMTRNEYDSTRELVRSGTILPNALTVVGTSANFQIGDMPIALSKLFDYDEYKVTKIQMVLTPMVQSTGATDLNVNNEGDPYLYIVPRVHSNVISGTPSIQTVKTSPGVMRFHYLRKKPIVVNLAPFAQVEEDLITGTGAAVQQEIPLKKLGWIHNPQDAAPYNTGLHVNYGNVYFYLPRIVAGSFIPRWRVEYYATAIFRGNRNLLDI